MVSPNLPPAPALFVALVITMALLLITARRLTQVERQLARIQRRRQARRRARRAELAAAIDRHPAGSNVRVLPIRDRSA